MYTHQSSGDLTDETIGRIFFAWKPESSQDQVVFNYPVRRTKFFKP